MHHDHIEALHTVRDLGLRLKPEDVARVDVSVHPPFTDLRTVQTLVEKEHMPLALGAQHCSDEDAGARTGEVSPRFLARLGTAYVIVGHSERRTLFGMDDATVASTLRAVLRNGMTPVLCVGESEEQRDGGHTEGVLEEQVLAALSGLAAEVVAGLVIAYEPIWAIGSGKPATAVDAEDACVFIRSLVAKVGGDEAAASGPPPVRGLGERRERGRFHGRAGRGRPAGGGCQPGGGRLHRHHSGHRRLLPFLGRTGCSDASWRLRRAGNLGHSHLDLHRH